MALLSTRLHVPLPRRELVPRARLTDRLRTRPGSAPRLVLVAAPAGFGKTTFLTQWLQTTQPTDGTGPSSGRSTRVAWLSLDPRDSDLRRFLSHVLAAVQSASPATGVEARVLLDADRVVATEQVLVSLVNDLDSLAGPTVLALDDYHMVDDPSVHEAVTFLLENLPPQVTLALATRADPPLPLARLRARGELLEILTPGCAPPVPVRSPGRRSVVRRCDGGVVGQAPNGRGT